MKILLIAKNIISGFWKSRGMVKEKAIICTGGLGDTFYSVLFMDAYIREHKLDHNIRVFLPANQKGIKDICGPELGVYEYYDSKDKEPYHYFSVFANRINSNYKLINLEASVLGAKKLSEAMVRQNFEEVIFYDVMKLHGVMPDIQLCHETAAKQNKVLVVPDSNSLVTFNLNFWKELIERLKERFDDVYVNISSRKELNSVDGTKVYKESISDLFSTAGEYKYIVSIRNGVCDILAKQRCRLMALYPTDSSLSEYTLENVRRECELVEVVFENTPNFMNTILSSIDDDL